MPCPTLAILPPILRRCRRGGVAVEHCLLLALIVLVVVSGVSAVGSVTKGLWTTINRQIPDVA